MGDEEIVFFSRRLSNAATKKKQQRSQRITKLPSVPQPQSQSVETEGRPKIEMTATITQTSGTRWRKYLKPCMKVVCIVLGLALPLQVYLILNGIPFHVKHVPVALNLLEASEMAEYVEQRLEQSNLEIFVAEFYFPWRTNGRFPATGTFSDLRVSDVIFSNFVCLDKNGAMINIKPLYSHDLVDDVSYALKSDLQTGLTYIQLNVDNQTTENFVWCKFYSIRKRK
jgi:hypothetical protein